MLVHLELETGRGWKFHKGTLASNILLLLCISSLGSRSTENTLRSDSGVLSACPTSAAGRQRPLEGCGASLSFRSWEASAQFPSLSCYHGENEEVTRECFINDKML